jgi:hypothetical protein
MGTFRGHAVPEIDQPRPADSERFRCVPRTCGPPYGRLEAPG